METLIVTSPIVYDPRAEASQKILNGHNVFGKDFLDGPVDGQFGPQTGAAAVHAKQFIGYPPRELRPTYGELLDQYLKGKRLIPDEYKHRSASTQQKKVTMRERALRIALAEVGTKESPMNTNRQKYGVWYGVNGVAWCAIFGTWVYCRAGSKAFAKGARWAYVPYFVGDARAGRNGLKAISAGLVLPGDPLGYDWDGGVADHFGIFRRWLRKGKTFEAVEGNTAEGNDSNGGEVMVRERSVRQVEQFVRVMR